MAAFNHKRNPEKRKHNPVEETISRKYKPGDRVFGARRPNAYPGVFVRAYVTLNTNWGGTYRNMGYVVKCDIDGKERKFQVIAHESTGAECYNDPKNDWVVK